MTHFDTHLLDSFETLDSSKCENQYTCDELGVSIVDAEATLGTGDSCRYADKGGRSLFSSGECKQLTMAECMTELAGCVLGQFRTRLTRWMTAASVEQKEATREWDMWCDVQEVGVSERWMLQKFAARSYYADTLGVTTDMRLRPLAIVLEDAEDGRESRDTS